MCQTAPALAHLTDFKPAILVDRDRQAVYASAPGRWPPKAFPLDRNGCSLNLPNFSVTLDDESPSPAGANDMDRVPFSRRKRGVSLRSKSTMPENIEQSWTASADRPWILLSQRQQSCFACFLSRSLSARSCLITCKSFSVLRRSSMSAIC